MMLKRLLALSCIITLLLGAIVVATDVSSASPLEQQRARKRRHVSRKSSRSRKSRARVRRVAIAHPIANMVFTPPNAPLFNTSSILLENQWVDSVFATLTDDQKIGQFFMLAVHPNNGEGHFKKVETLVNNYGVGGVIFFKSEPHLQAQINNRLQSQARVPLLVSIDGEWGLAMRMNYTMAFPKQITLGAIQDNDLIYRMGQEIARQCKRLGVHLNFAPVVDINSNPNNPIIGHRSFGELRENVAAKSSAYMRGMQAEQLLACAKHFPGHGDTHGDSHRTLPQLAYSAQRLKDMELYPFQRLINDSIKSVIVGHLQVPVYDWKPATLSPTIVTNLLKQEMGFKGLVITDALNMRGVQTSPHIPGGVDLQAFLAGNDILLYSENIPEGIRKIKEAITNGTIPQAEVDYRVKKILHAKYWVGLNKFKYVETTNLYQDLHTQEAAAIRQELFNNAVTLVKNDQTLLPMSGADKKLVSVGIDINPDNGLERALDQYGNFQHFTSGGKNLEAFYNEVLRSVDSTSTVVVGIHDLKNTPYTRYGVSTSMQEFIKKLEKKTNVILCVFGNPYSLKYFNESKTVICGYEDVPEAHKAVANVIFGRLSAKGKLPVSVEGLYKAGDGIITNQTGLVQDGNPEGLGFNSTTLNQIDTIVQNAIEQKAFPGCQVVVARKGQIVYQKNFGRLSYESSSNPVNDQTIYDLASVTKVSATLQAIMALYDQKKIDLEQKVSFYLEELRGTNKEHMTIKDVLWHQAGLVAYIPFWSRTRTPLGWKNEYYSNTESSEYPLQVAEGMYAKTAIRDSVWHWVIQSSLTGKKDKEGHYGFVYSDLGLIMMQHLVEKVSGQTLDVLVKNTFYQPLGLATTGYNPLQRFPKVQMAPTENDKIFRERLLQGTVQDQTAAMLGGVSGHAGLFSSAKDLAILMQMNLLKGSYAGKKYLEESTVEYFTQTKSPRSHRSLGWDRLPAGGSSSYISSLVSPTSYGHSGYTGTLVWVDPSKEIVFVFLSNRVNTSAENTKINTLGIRRKVMDVVYKALK